MEEYEGYLKKAKTCVRVNPSTTLGDPYGVTLKAVVELQENVGEALHALYKSAVPQEESSSQPEEPDLKTIETQPTPEALPTTLDLETKDLDSSFLGTLPGASFILSETSAGPSLRDLLGEAIPDLSFVLSATVCR